MRYIDNADHLNIEEAREYAHSCMLRDQSLEEFEGIKLGARGRYKDRTGTVLRLVRMNPNEVRVWVYWDRPRGHRNPTHCPHKDWHPLGIFCPECSSEMPLSDDYLCQSCRSAA